MAVPGTYQDLLVEQTPALFRRALLLCHDWQLAEDLVQDTAEIALKRWRQVDAASNKPAYLHSILTNHFLGMTRRRSFHERPAEVLKPETVDPWEGLDLEISLANAMSVLNPTERSIVIARYLDDRSVSDVAADFGRDDSWVRVTAHRALKKMRMDLEAERELEPGDVVTNDDVDAAPGRGTRTVPANDADSEVRSVKRGRRAVTRDAKSGSHVPARRAGGVN